MLKLLCVCVISLAVWPSVASAGDVTDLERMVRIRFSASACEIPIKDETARWIDTMIERSPSSDVYAMESEAPEIFQYYVDKEGYASYCYQLRLALTRLGWLD